MIDRIPWLAIGGGLSLAAAFAHLACIVGGPAWYRFFGAGERLAQGVERGALMPHVITFGIAALLATWAAYAFSGAGLIGRLPLLKLALIAITAVYLLRGLVLFRPSLLGRADLSDAFLLWSSLIVLVMGIVHVIGIWRGWNTL